MVATVVAVLDVVFILFFVPESLESSDKLKLKSVTFKQVRKQYNIEISSHTFHHIKTCTYDNRWNNFETYYGKSFFVQCQLTLHC